LRIAVALPGQGSQKVGMGRDFCETFAVAREVFDEASEVLALDLRALCFHDDPRLAETEFQQPAILAVEVAMVRSLVAAYGIEVAIAAGHSLGEYTALTVMGALPFDVALELVRRRGALMQQAVPLGRGGMTAIIASPVDRDILAEVAARGGVDIANDNSPDQAVLAGPLEALEQTVALLREESAFGRFRPIPLRVSAPFHSRMMRPAAEHFRPWLEEACARGEAPRAAAVASNATGVFHSGTCADLVDGLARQMATTVRWRENMELLRAARLPVFEIGPGRPLRGFLAAAAIESDSISSIEQAREAFEDAGASG
jgi:malonyl CoA-acyl carrier protein transacylase